jgi:hypothetical protein
MKAGSDRKREVRDLVAQVRRILLEDWDPLGVGGMPGLADEYDFVLGPAVSGLATARDQDAVIGLLSELERDYLCLPEPRPDLCVRAAERLLALRRSTKNWPNAAMID